MSSISDVVNEALRDAFARAREVVPFTMICYGGAGRRACHEPKELASALEAEDLERLR